MRFPWLFDNSHSGKCMSVVILFILVQSTIYGQEIRVNGGFLTDSLKIGEQTAYYLSAHYPSNVSILFPDSSDSFVPFDYQRKKYFSTETTDGISVDSAVYYLTTFEVGRVQYLDLPVYVLQGQDCTVVRTEPDSVYITQFVSHVPDTLSAAQLPLKMNTTYQKVFMQFNVWVLVIVLGVLIVMAILVWAFFGKKIRRYFLAKRLRRNHSEFVSSYNSFIKGLQHAFSPGKTESALSVWKKYMEQLDARPYTKLTTHETFKLIKEASVTEHLSRIDKAIYGHNTSVVESLENLKSYADQQFARKLKEVKHG